MALVILVAMSTVGGVPAARAAAPVAPTTPGEDPFAGPDHQLSDAPNAFQGPVPKAHCGTGSDPETALQGEVPHVDRVSGRSMKGYSCNLKRIGQYQGEGASWVAPSYGTCAYMPTRWPSQADEPGVQVLDVSDPSHPQRTARLQTPAMLGPWESLKVNDSRGLLAAVFGGPAVGGGFFDVYDIREDCRHPRLLASISSADLLAQAPASVLQLGAQAITGSLLLGHEGAFSPDGKTYWASGLALGALTAIDLDDPAHPRIAFSGSTGALDHGFGFNEDGTRLYMASVGNLAETLTGVPFGTFQDVAPNGLQIFDISSIQDRGPTRALVPLGHAYWNDGSTGQAALPLDYNGHPYVVFVDEGGSGGPRIIDVADEHDPRVVSKLKLEINMPQAASDRAADLENSHTFSYESHYCTADRTVNPTALACGYFHSGIRVFDIRHPRRPREIAYYNPPAQTGRNAQLKGSEHAGGFGLVGLNLVSGDPEDRLRSIQPDLSSDMCTSPPRFVGHELWTTCTDNGFMTLKFTNGAYPLRAKRACARGRTVVVRIRRRYRGRVRSAKVLIGSQRVGAFRSGREATRVRLHGRRSGVYRVRVVMRLRSGARVTDVRRYPACRR